MIMEEQQRFESPWIWVPVIGFAVIFCFFIVRSAIGNFSGLTPNPLFGSILVGSLCIPLLIIILLWKSSFTVGVYSNEIRFRLKPFHFSDQLIPISKIKEVEVISFRPLRDFGGYGIRYGQGGKAYIVSGGKGVRIKCNDGTTFVLGSQNPQKLAESINQNLTR